MKGGSAVSAPEEKKKREYSRYDQMSTAELEQLLRLDFYGSEGGAADLDTILYLSDLLARRNGPSDPEAAWEQFQTKYRPYAHGRSLYDFEDGEDVSPAKAEQVPPAVRPRRTRRLRRLAVLAAVLAALFLCGMAAQAGGMDILDAIAQWTDETFRFTSAASGSGTGHENTVQYQAPLQAVGMDSLFPTWSPDGFTPGELKITELNDSVSAHVNFFGEDRTYSVTIVHFTQPTDNTGTFEKDDTPVEEYDHSGQTFYILSNIDTLTAAAFDGEFMTMICGGLTREEIKAVIDSIPSPQALQNQEQVQDSPAEQG